jgi:hypothetical protein
MVFGFVQIFPVLTSWLPLGMILIPALSRLEVFPVLTLHHHF